MRIIEDAIGHPATFVWTGAPDANALGDAVAGLGAPIPHELVEFWRVTGGGVAFETEEFVLPVAVGDLVETVAGVNGEHRRRGLAEGYVVFQKGVFVSAVRLADGWYVTLVGDSLREDREFDTFEAWYAGTLRKEFADRYGLPALPAREL